MSRSNFAASYSLGCDLKLNAANETSIFVSLAGPFRIWAADHQIIDITSVMSKRLIALLLTAPNMRRARASLQLLLWDDAKSDPAGSLRQLLRQTRKRLGSYEACLVADNATISLVGVADQTAAGLVKQMDFFEDAGVGTEDFEDWYRLERANFEALEIIPRKSPIVASWQRSARPVVAITTAGLNSISHRAGIAADWVSNHLRDVLVWNAFVEFHDLRENRANVSYDLEVRTSVIEIGDQIEISIATYRNGACLSSHSRHYPSGNALSTARLDIMEFAHRVGTLVERTVSTVPSTAQSSLPMLYDSVRQLFTLHPVNVVRATARLGDIRGFHDAPYVMAWQAFGLMLQNGERLIDDGEQANQAAGAILEAAYARNSLDLSTLCAFAHYQAFVKRDNAYARELIEVALDIAPSSHFALDVRATLELYEDRLKAAIAFGEQALLLGRYGAMGGYLAGTEVMLASLAGNHVQAIQVGRAILRKRPNFLPVLRYMTPSLLETEAHDEASDMLMRVRSLDPDYGTKKMLRDDYDMPSALSKEYVTKILKKHGEV